MWIFAFSGDSAVLPITVVFYKDCIDVVSLLTEIIKLLLIFGKMPNDLKLVIIKLLLIILSLDYVKHNYGPISNLRLLLYKLLITSLPSKQHYRHIPISILRISYY